MPPFALRNLCRGDVIVDARGDRSVTYLILSSYSLLGSYMWRVEWIELMDGSISILKRSELPPASMFIYSSSPHVFFGRRGTP